MEERESETDFQLGRGDGKVKYLGTRPELSLAYRNLLFGAGRRGFREGRPDPGRRCTG
jgi:hypothetical protein